MPNDIEFFSFVVMPCEVKIRGGMENEMAINMRISLPP